MLLLSTQIEGGACEMQIGVKMRGVIDGEIMEAHLTAAGDQLLEQLHPRIDLLASRLLSEYFLFVKAEKVINFLSYWRRRMQANNQVISGESDPEKGSTGDVTTS
jgi:hypothetical protein